MGRGRHGRRDTGDLPEHLIAGAAAFAFLLLAALAYPAGMGMGDVKLAGVMGLYLGLSVAPALLTAFSTGTLAGVAIIAREGAEARRRRSRSASSWHSAASSACSRGPSSRTSTGTICRAELHYALGRI